MAPFVTARNNVTWNDVARAPGAINYAGAFTFETRNAFDGVPDALLDDHFCLAAKIGR